MILYAKKPGYTLNSCIKDIRHIYHKSANQKIAYAGRLDPMAGGLLMILEDEECKKRHEYQAMDKEYSAEIFFGITTDTGDFLGMMENPYELVPVETFSLIQKVIHEFPRVWDMYYSPYSSKRVQGKPLFWWSRNQLLHTIEIPKKTVSLYTLEVISYKMVDCVSILQNACAQISTIEGDFRQDLTLSQWHTLIKDPHIAKSKTLSVKIRVVCSSGAYIRQLGREIGERALVRSCLSSLHRTKIGPYTIEQCRL